MRIKDMVVGEEYVVYRSAASLAERVRLIEVGLPRPTDHPRNREGLIYDCVLAQPLHEATGQPNGEEPITLTVRAIERTWAEELRSRAQRVQAQERIARTREQADRVQRLLAEVGVPSYVRAHAASRMVEIVVTHDFTALEELLETHLQSEREEVTRV
jgi:hypothetical protein